MIIAGVHDKCRHESGSKSPGAGTLSRDLTKTKSLQFRDYTWALYMEKSISQLFLEPWGDVVANDWCIIGYIFACWCLCFQPTKFIDSITMLRRLEGEIDLKRKQLTTLRIDATSLEAVKQLKGTPRQGVFCPSLGAEIRPHSQSKK